jgi:hypothetical protein
MRLVDVADEAIVHAASDELAQARRKPARDI